MADTRTRKDGTPYAPKGPEVRWDNTRWAALIRTIKQYDGDITTSDLASLLAADQAFTGVEASAITAGKVRLQLAKLHSDGVDVPKLKRAAGGGGGRNRVEVDVDALNAILAA